MTNMFKAAMVAGAIVASAAVAVPAQAQVAAVDLEKAIADSAAYKTAQGQIETTYKAQIDAARARSQAVQAELQPLAQELQTLQQNSATPPATLQQKATAFQQRRDAAQRELQTLQQPFARPNAYAQQQVAEKVEAALRAAMTAKRITIVLKPDAAILTLPAGDLTADVTAQLNQTVKTVSITPPANWQPGQPTTAAPPANR